jgi:hypothetical protein
MTSLQNSPALKWVAVAALLVAIAFLIRIMPSQDSNPKLEVIPWPQSKYTLEHMRRSASAGGGPVPAKKAGPDTGTTAPE